MAPLQDDEILPGVCVLIDPTTLLNDEEVEYSCEPRHAVASQHLFLCVERSMDRSRWIPLSSSNPSGRRFQIPPEEKLGMWNTKPSFVIHGNQVWRGPNRAFVAASADCASAVGNRNRVEVTFLPQVEAEIQNQRGFTSAVASAREA